MEDVYTAKSTQEQAVASWIDYLNQIRIDRLMNNLKFEQKNLDDARKTIRRTLEVIDKDIVHKGQGRGGEKGMHGFIAEAAQWGIGNAKKQIEGKSLNYAWVNDNGPADLVRDGIEIQQKFVNSGGHLSLQAILKHMEKYPDFLKNGGKYQIPSDHFEKIKWLLSIPEDQANKMPTSTGEFSMKQWREVHELLDNGKIPLDAIEPSDLGYREVQRETYESTFAKEKKELKDRNKERKQETYQESKPSIEEGAKASAVAAGVEAATAFAIPIPVVGAVIGNAVGTVVYKIAKDNLSTKEQALLESYYEEVNQLSADLEEQYRHLLSDLSNDMILYLGILDKAFSPDPMIAINGSIELAKQMGVPCEEILDTKEKIDSYFLD